MKIQHINAVFFLFLQSCQTEDGTAACRINVQQAAEKNRDC